MTKVNFSWEESDLPKLDPIKGGEKGIDDSILLENTLWFIRIRWGVMISFLMLQLSFCLDADYLIELNLKENGYWPLLIILLLGIGNLKSWLWVRQGDKKSVTKSIILQMALDLFALSIFVHFAGSIFSPAPALFLMHIVISCIFFKNESSLKITIAVLLLYNSLITMEYLKIIETEPFVTILGNVDYREKGPIIFIFSGGISFFFLSVWVVVSRLSSRIKLREEQLVKSLEVLEELQKDREKYTLQMTHQLKSPIATVGSNLKLISQGFAGDVSKKVAELVEKSERKLSTLGNMILEVLRLSRLDSSTQEGWEEFDLSEKIRAIAESMSNFASERKIEVECEIQPDCIVKAAPEEIKMLFDNLILNAIIYSNNSGKVHLSSQRVGDKVVAKVKDVGIGIASEKLPHIFDEYFRTKEAIEHNKNSTGIGLAIVKKVCMNNQVEVGVQSERNVGTEFTLTFQS